MSPAGRKVGKAKAKPAKAVPMKSRGKAEAKKAVKKGKGKVKADNPCVICGKPGENQQMWAPGVSTWYCQSCVGGTSSSPSP